MTDHEEKPLQGRRTTGTTAEQVMVESPFDLQPMDMIREGVFVSVIHLPGGRVEAATCGVTEHEGPDGQTVWGPDWGEPVEVSLSYPTTVVRGAWPPTRSTEQPVPATGDDR